MTVYGRIYVITNKVNGKQYVGQTTLTLRSRWRSHRASAKGRHEQCRALEHAIQKYGAESFSIGPLAEASSPSELDVLERYWIKALSSRVPKGYNIKEGGAHGKHSPETRQRIGDAFRGRPKTDQQKRLIGDAQRGALNHRYGKRNTAEHKKKCSDALSGERNTRFGFPMSESQRQRLRDAHLGRKQSPEWIAKVVAANLGAKRSEAAKVRMAAAQQAWWAQDTEATRAAKEKIRLAKKAYWANWRAQRGAS